MKWFIPAKTFLVGEYAALAGLGALILTTSPCFELSLTDEQGLHGIHPDSPAGRWWLRHGDKRLGLRWTDPYAAIGGLGASSAQFLGAYWASAFPNPSNQDLLDAYFEVIDIGNGVKPSGYDVLAQSLRGCVYIHCRSAQQVYDVWPFQDVAFVLLHTGQKLATHLHLKNMDVPLDVLQLSAIVCDAKRACDEGDGDVLVQAVKAYHQKLCEMRLVTEETRKKVEDLQAMPDVLAAKGCGAMGADVLLLLVPMARLAMIKERLESLNWRVLATSEDLGP